MKLFFKNRERRLLYFNTVNGNSDRLYFLGLHNHCGQWLQPWNSKMLAPWRKAMTNLGSILKSRDITLPTKVHIVKAMVFPWRRKWQPTPVFLPGESQYRGALVGCPLRGRTESDTAAATEQQRRRHGFSSSHIQMRELDRQEGWARKNWCFQIVVLEKILESPLDCKEIKPVNPKENQLWILTEGVSNTLVRWCKEPAQWKRPSWWEILKAKGEGGGRGWDD